MCSSDLFWVFVVVTPLQFVLVGIGAYNFYTILIPVYASLFIFARIAISGDPKRFLERSAKIQAGLLICVYALSHAPAILSIQLSSVAEDGSRAVWDQSRNPGLLFYFVLLVQLSEVFQYMWGRLLGKRVIAPTINASRTWEGLMGGVLTTGLVGGLLWKVTPFAIWESSLIALAIAMMGFAGSMTMSAIKRDRGIKDWGHLIEGHGGMLDRLERGFMQASRFSADAAHELKTPLAILQGQVERAIAQAPEGSALQASLTGILDEKIGRAHV